MRKLIAILLLFSLPSYATSYFVANGGSDSNNGLTSLTPWQHVSKVNSSTITGDTTQFNCGDTWHELLTIPGSTYTVTSYGTCAGSNNPIFDAADVITGWSLTSGSTYQAVIGFSPNEVIRTTTRMVKVAITPTVDNTWQVTGGNLLICCGDPTALTIEASNRSYGIRFDDKSGITISNVQCFYSNSAASGCISSGETSPVSTFNYSNVNVVRSYGPGFTLNPGTAGAGAYTNVSISGLTMDHACDPENSSCGGNGGMNTGLGGDGTVFCGINNLNVSNSTIQYSGVHDDISVASRSTGGMYLSNVCGGTLAGVNFNHNGSSAFIADSNSNTITVSGPAQWHDDGNGGVGDDNELDLGGINHAPHDIIIGGTAIGVCSGLGIDMYSSTKGVVELASTNIDEVPFNITVQCSRIRNGLSHGIQIGGGLTGVLFLYDQIYGNAGYGYFSNQGSSGDPTVIMYGINFDSNGSAPTPNNLFINNNNTTIENSIIRNAFGAEVQVSNTFTLTSDYNNWYHPAGGTFMQYHGTTYNFTNWQINSGQDAHGQSADPLYQSSSTGNFSLRPRSPSIRAGVNLSSTYQNSFNPLSATFPFTTVNQNIFGNFSQGSFAFNTSIAPSSPQIFADNSGVRLRTER